MIDLEPSNIRSKNFNAKDAAKTVEDVGAVDSDGNVPANHFTCKDFMYNT